MKLFKILNQLKSVVIIAIMFCSTASIKAQNEDGWELAEQKTVNENVSNNEEKNNIKYCLSFADYKSGVWNDAGDVTIIKRTDDQILWSGGTALQLKSTNKQINAILNKKAFAVICDSILYVNLYKKKNRGARFGKGYAVGYKFDNNSQILFLERYISSAKQLGKNMLASSTVFMGGIVGAAVGATMINNSDNADIRNKVCYLISDDSNDVQCIDDKNIGSILANNNDLLDKYYKIEEKTFRRSASNVIPILKASGYLNDKIETE